MIIGTYRPAEVNSGGHPLRGLKRELQMHRQCLELPLAYLGEESIAQYLGARFARSEFPATLTHVIRQRTAGKIRSANDRPSQKVVRGVRDRPGNVIQRSAILSH